MTDKCKHCHNGYLGGGDIECVNGVLIDIDVAHEGWQDDVDYPPAPCMACTKCKGRGGKYSGAGDCPNCNGTGWKTGKNESHERLNQWAATAPDEMIGEPGQ